LAEEIIDKEEFDEEMEKYLREEFNESKISESLRSSMIEQRKRR
jgi:hypothetical protein